jgi:hypothetical protein
MIVRHEKSEYYENMVGYCQKLWPESSIPPGHAEQDGLINRIRETLKGQTVYPEKPRAFHAGFHGYNRKGGKLTGTVQQRSAKILSMSSEEMNALAYSMKDHEVIDLDELLPIDEEVDALKWHMTA